MARIHVVLLLLSATACYIPQVPIDHRVRQLHAPDPEVREREFKNLSRAPEEILPLFRRHLPEGRDCGYPIAALLYNLGEGDAVPLEIKAQHYARFDWPSALSTEKAIGEPYVWNEVARDLVRAGRPALRLLSDALGSDAPDEARAMRVAGLMIRIGGPNPRESLPEFERLLASDRRAGTVPVRDIAAAAILHLLYRDVALDRAKDRVAEAKRALESTRGRSEEDWIRDGVAAAEGDERWRDYAGRHRIDPALEARSSAELAAAFETNPWWIDRLLERRTGIRLATAPLLLRLEDLGEVRRKPPPDPLLGLKWRRWLESRMLRLTIVKAGLEAKSGRGAMLGASEQRFHCSEDETGGGGGDREGWRYLLFVQSLELGTRVSVSEYLFNEKEILGGTHQAAVEAGIPLAFFPPGTDHATFLRIEEDPVSRPPLPPDFVRQDFIDSFLKRLDRPESARALAYLGADSAAPELLKLGTPACAEALVLLGDSRGLDLLEKAGGVPSLSRRELEWAVRAARDDRLRTWARARLAAP